MTEIDEDTLSEQDALEATIASPELLEPVFIGGTEIQPLPTHITRPLRDD